MTTPNSFSDAAHMLTLDPARVLREYAAAVGARAEAEATHRIDALCNRNTVLERENAALIMQVASLREDLRIARELRRALVTEEGGPIDADGEVVEVAE